MPEKDKLENWKILGNRDVYDAYPWIRVSVHKVRLPNGKVVDNFHRVKMPEYAVVVAETPEGLLVMERQYKHGVGRVSLMLPGGMIEEGEDAFVAAKRELLEETGYSAESWELLGSFVANANYGCGKAHIFRVQDATLVQPPDSGDLEDINILLMKPQEVIHAIRDGEIAALSAMAAILLATVPLGA